MEARDLLASLRKHGLFLLVVVALCTGAAAALAASRPPVYQSQVQFFVSPGANVADPSQAYQGGLFSQQRVLSYAEIVDGPAVAAAVAQESGVALSPEAVGSRIRASVPLNSAILDVEVRDRYPGRVQAIAVALSRVFPRYVAALERPGDAAASPVKLSVTSPPVRPTTPQSPLTPLSVAIGALLGVSIGVAGCVVLDQRGERPRVAARVVRRSRISRPTPQPGKRSGAPEPS